MRTASLTVIPSYSTHFHLPRSYCREPRSEFTEILLTAGGYEQSFLAVPFRGWVQHSMGTCPLTSGFTVLMVDLPRHSSKNLCGGLGWCLQSFWKGKALMAGWKLVQEGLGKPGPRRQLWNPWHSQLPGLKCPHLLTPGSAGGYSKVIISHKFRVNCSLEWYCI